MSRRSKPRKSGEYVGGRPWPKVCPKCRYCGGEPPKLFYRARGLCNICYKQINNTEELNKYEPLPEVCSDISLASLHKNPRRWLQKEMGRTHASQFSDKSILEEATRVFQLSVARWYGKETPPAVAYEKESIEDLIWGNQHPDPGPMSIEDAIVLKNASKSKSAAHRRNLALLFWREHGAISHVTLKSKYKDVRKPKISCLGDAVTATWGIGRLYLSVTSMTNGDIFVVLEREQEVLLEEDFRVSRLADILKAAFDFQKVDRSS
jgi:hypothetical protein